MDRPLEAEPPYRLEKDAGIVAPPPATPVPAPTMVKSAMIPSPPTSAAAPAVIPVMAAPPVVPLGLGGRRQSDEQAAGDHRRTAGQQKATGRIRSIGSFERGPVKHIMRDDLTELSEQALVHLLHLRPLLAAEAPSVSKPALHLRRRLDCLATPRLHPAA
jgi:hypothetical protein